MRNEVVRHVCVKVLKNYLVRSGPFEPFALGSKLVRAGVTPEDVQGIWRDVVGEIARDVAAARGAANASFSDSFRDFLDEYQAVIVEDAYKPPRALPVRRRIEERTRPSDR